MRCEHCGAEGGPFYPLVMPTVGTEGRHPIVRRIICPDCVESLAAWWYLPVVERSDALLR